MTVTKLLIFLAMCIALSACAAAKSARTANDLVDDGKRNTILLSYEIRLDSHDRYPGVNSTQLALRCGPNKSLNPYPVCFYITVPFQGKRQENDFIINSFETSGVQIYQMKYGEYNLARVSHSVKVGQRQDRICKPARKHHLFRCHTEYVDVKADYVASLPSSNQFRITEGEGCYLGHLQLHLRGSKIVSYELDTSFDEKVVSQLPESTQAKARARVTQPCIQPQI